MNSKEGDNPFYCNERFIFSAQAELCPLGFFIARDIGQITKVKVFSIYRSFTPFSNYLGVTSQILTGREL